MSDELDRWASNRAGTTDALVGWVRSLIPRLEDKNAATRAIYAHVKAIRLTPCAKDHVRPGHHPPCKAMLDQDAICTCGQ